jgi:beta-glucosidase
MPLNRIIIISFLAFFTVLQWACSPAGDTDDAEKLAGQLLQKMTLEEKIGQLQLVHSPGGELTEDLLPRIAGGEVGAILNEARPGVIRQLQKAAVEESRLGIPLLFGRDVIHGFKTVFPVNIGMAATFNPDLVREGAHIASVEASGTGINWYFAPMVDIARDPRWGRMAESFGEDPFLVTEMGLAMLKGFRDAEDPGRGPKIIACAKHFAGYGAVEGGRDYNTASIPEVELWNIHFRPFLALKEAGISTFMTAFNELNGIPASGNEFLFSDILKGRWKFEGFVVSDWASIAEMRIHGYVAGDRDAAARAMLAGIDMEMAGITFKEHLPELIASGEVPADLLDDAVRRILKVKYEAGLFSHPYADPEKLILTPPLEHLEVAKRIAIQSLVLLKNEHETLPLREGSLKVAVIGPMANDRYEQLGTWIFDGDTNLSITPLKALQDMLGAERVYYARGLPTTRSESREGFPDAIKAARAADVAIIFAGEESILTGEAHSRACLNLPGAQDELVMEIAKTGKPLVLVVMTPRPLTIGEIAAYADAVLYAWHPGTMGGPAIAEVLTGRESPSGKLPVTFPKTAGQIPVYYSHKNTGRPFDANSFIPVDEIPVRSFQTSLGNTSHYMDIGFEPLYPFGYGLSYTTFEYGGLQLSRREVEKEETITVSAELLNTGMTDAEEVVQLYVRDLVASITRPVKELKAFKRVLLPAGESRTVEFTLAAGELGFYDKDGNYILEPGDFQIWIGGSSDATLSAIFTIIPWSYE